MLLGVGEGATFPVATRAMQTGPRPSQRGFAQGITHAFARFGNAMTPPLVAWLILLVTLARLVRHRSAACSLVWVDRVGAGTSATIPAEHRGITAEELDELPESRRRAATVPAATCRGSG